MSDQSLQFHLLVYEQRQEPLAQNIFYRNEYETRYSKDNNGLWVKFFMQEQTIKQDLSLAKDKLVMHIFS